MSRADAIRLLTEAGVFANERQWSFGDSICVFSFPGDGDEVRAFKELSIIYPADSAVWAVQSSWDGSSTRGTDRLFSSLAEAVFHVLENMPSPAKEK